MAAPGRLPQGHGHHRPAPGVGDWVLIEGRKAVVALLPRRSAIKRGAAGEHYQQQLIAANVDTVFIVCGLDADFNPRRIERYLLLVRGGGVEPVVVLTKADQADAATPKRCPARWRRWSNWPRRTSRCARSMPRTPTASPALHRWLRPGRTAVLVGSPAPASRR